MRKIDGHLHLVRSLAGAKGQGRLTPIGHGRAIWDDGEIIKLIPDAGTMTISLLRNTFR